MLAKKKSKILLHLTGLVMIFLTFSCGDNTFSMGSKKEPTAIVVDAETGEPIEGAVAIAIWREKDLSKGSWFEGGGWIPVRIEEAVSDMEGKIYIDDFWDWHFFKGRYPHLTIYQPSYVCWDQEYIFPSWEKRTGFNKEHRTVKMERWKKGYSFNDHETFVRHCTMGHERQAKKKLFRKALEYERPYRIYEIEREYKQRKHMEKKEGQK